jgi:hypothetical protein
MRTAAAVAEKQMFLRQPKSTRRGTNLQWPGQDAMTRFLRQSAAGAMAISTKRPDHSELLRDLE